jgi:fructosamine-3-kinase
MAELPQPVRQGVEQALSNLGSSGRVTDAEPVSGGCINHGARIKTSAGRTFFLKWNAHAPPHMFEAEAAGLRALAEHCPVRIPTPVARGGGAGVPGWLLMEFIPAGRPTPEYGRVLGRALATLHAAGGADSFGWPRHNYIGSLKQSNTTSDSWADFWARERLQPQLDLARSQGYLTGADGRIMDDLMRVVPAALEDVDRSAPSVLHGDLWNGNAYADDRGAPVLIDPAVYAGHGEVDLAMTELFGGFGSGFYDAYGEVVPITDAYHVYRRDLYQLYYLLVHVNLFGSSYVQGSTDAARRVVEALR